MKYISFYVGLYVLVLLGCKAQQLSPEYVSENLTVDQLTKNTFRHVSYLSTEDFGKVSCNGMIVIDQGEAIVMDTPTSDKDSKELIEWIENNLNSAVVGVVVTHFHVDCLGGLGEFHERNIPSYASYKTLKLAKTEDEILPQNGFENSLEIKVGSRKVLIEFFGEGHTKDNIVCYFPDEKVLFGGCLIKSLNASKGFLGDANTAEWSNSVQAIKSKYGDLQVVVPGHGKPGNIDLLDYTIALFKKE